MKTGFVLILSLLSSSALSEIFEARVLYSQAANQSEEGKRYNEKVFDIAASEHRECFRKAISEGAVLGSYELVATIGKNGKIVSVEVQPINRFSSCVAIAVANNSYPVSPKNNWPYYMKVNIQP